MAFFFALSSKSHLNLMLDCLSLNECSSTHVKLLVPFKVNFNFKASEIGNNKLNFYNLNKK